MTPATQHRTLAAPAPRPGMIPRPRLDDPMHAGTSRPLTVVAAPAGYGKTTLVADWVARHARPYAWLSLKPQDDDASRFGDTLTTALRALGTATEAVSPQPLVDDVIAKLAVEDPTLLVLDDYHCITDPQIHRWVTALLHTPSLHVVLITRTRPPLPLNRMRVRDQVTEVGANDLAFDSTETAEFLVNTMAIEVAPEAATRLWERTEGWAAALQMAALAIRRGEPATTVAERFGAADRDMTDYLFGESLAGLGAEPLELLGDSSVLKELTAERIQAVVGIADAQPWLDRMVDAQLLRPVRGRPSPVYQHHPLLREGLANQLSPSRKVELHLLASEVLAADDIGEAFAHAIAAQAWDRAEALVTKLTDLRLILGQEEALLAELALFPADEFASRPAVMMKRAWALETQAAQEHDLRDALERIEKAGQGRLTDTVRGELAHLRGFLLMKRGDMDGAATLYAQAHPLLPPKSFARASLGMHRSVTAMAQDRLDEARQASRDIDDYAEASSHPTILGWSLWVRATLDFHCGNLEPARRAFDQMGQYLDATPGVDVRNAALAHLWRAAVLCEVGELDAAAEHAERAVALLGDTSDPSSAASAALLHARIMALAAPHNSAWLKRLEAFAQDLPLTAMTMVAEQVEALRVRLSLMAQTRGTNELSVVERWLTQGGVVDQTASVFQAPPDAIFRKDTAALILARALAVKGELDACVTLGAQLLDRARAAGRKIGEVEALLLLSQAARQAGDHSRFESRLCEAVDLAAPHTIAGPFLEHGRPSRAFAAAYARRCGFPTFANRIGLKGDDVPEMPQVLADPLTTRELEVLRMVASGLSNKESAKRMFVSPSTIKKHLENIYSKLGVRKRTLAAARAREIGLLSD